MKKLELITTTNNRIFINKNIYLHSFTNSYLEITDKHERIILEGNNHLINGNGKAARLIHIHDTKDLIIRNLTLIGGDTKIIKTLSRKQIFSTQKGIKSVFEILDGGGVLITGNSNVRFENCHFNENSSIMCGGAISNQSKGKVEFVNCTFINNTANHTGSAIDNLTKSSNLHLKNCSFENNTSNLMYKNRGPHGQITIFPHSRASIVTSNFKGGSITLDYIEGKSHVELRANKQAEKGSIEINKSPNRKSSFLETLKMYTTLSWLFPKTFGKVYYKVNK